MTQHTPPDEIHWFQKKDRRTWNARDPKTMRSVNLNPLMFLGSALKLTQSHPTLKLHDVAVVWRMGYFSIWVGLENHKRWHVFPGAMRHRTIIFEQTWSEPWKTLFWNLFHIPIIVPWLIKIAVLQWWEDRRQPPGGSKSPAP